MKTIYISTQILDGNLGDGWSDNFAAANALEKFIRHVWLADLEKFIADGFEVEIDIDVRQSTSGCPRDMSVGVVTADSENDFNLTRDVEFVLTDESLIWERFCESDEAAEFYSED